MPGGRPAKYRRGFHPREFVKLSKKGKSITQIACEWDVVRDTLYEWGRKHPEFSDAMKKGREACEAWYTNLGVGAMTGQLPLIDGKKMVVNLGFFVWMTKNVIKWSDKVETDQRISNDAVHTVKYVAMTPTGEEVQVPPEQLGEDFKFDQEL